MRQSLTGMQVFMTYQALKRTLEADIAEKKLYGMGGFCNRIHNFLHSMGISHINPYNPEEFEFYFPELYAYKPSKTFGPFWFQIHDHQSRLLLINQVLRQFN